MPAVLWRDERSEREGAGVGTTNATQRSETRGREEWWPCKDGEGSPAEHEDKQGVVEVRHRLAVFPYG